MTNSFTRPMDQKELEAKARWVRRVVLDTTAATGKGHLGGTFSCTDLLVALYYGGVLRFDPRNPKWPDRDRMLIGKGHACIALYAMLVDLGIMSQKRFDTYGVDGGLGGQLDTSIPGVEYNTGSLGHVLGIGAGMALASKLDSKDYRAYALLGDAECYEGAIWEALTFAGEQKLDKLVGIIDRNRLSVLDVLDDEGLFNEFPARVRSFGWECYEIDGHSFPEIFDVFKAVKSAEKPVMIVANTIKGKGVSFMENEVKWHHGPPGPQELELARKELSLAGE